MNPYKQEVIRAGHAAWRLLPREFRRRALTRVAAGIARKPDATPPAHSCGVIVAGEFGLPSGLAQSAVIMHEVIEAAGLARGCMPIGLPTLVPLCTAPMPADAALLAVVNAPIFPLGLLRLPRRFISGRRVIGLWAWELPEVPKTWHDGARFVHEIWAPSEFTAAALEPLAPGRVRVVPHPLAAVALTATGSRASFGLPEDVLIVLTIINLASSMVRKNPLGAIAACDWGCDEYPADNGDFAGVRIARADRRQRYCALPASLGGVWPGAGDRNVNGKGSCRHRLVW
jgi:hypothetical protein